MTLVLRLVEPAQSGVVDDPVHDDRRSGHTAVDVAVPAYVAGRRIESDAVAVPGTDVHLAPPDRRCGIDVRAHAPRPEQATAPGPEGVDRAVGVPDEDAPIRDRRRRVEVLATAEACERAAVPALATCPRVERVDGSAARRDVNQSVFVCGRGDDLVVRGERPAEPGAPRPAQAERVEPVIPGAEVQGAADDERARLDRAGVERPELPPGPPVPRDDEAAGVGRV